MTFRVPPHATVDFETLPIKARPEYPPRPLGVAIRKLGEKKRRYYSWGHDSNNNCTEAEGYAAVREVWASGARILCHHGKFDIDVAETFCGVPPLAWERFDDTMFLLFLKDPHLRNLGLKYGANHYCNIKPDAQDKLKEWLVDHKIIPRNASDKKVKEHLKECPGDLVGAYACDDLLMTDSLFDFLIREVHARGMMAAYDRERRLQPHLIASERQGVRVDIERLSRDLTETYLPALDRVKKFIFKRLKKEINLDSNEELADALEAAGMAAGFLVTATGKRSVSQESLRGAITDVPIFLALGYYARLTTALNMFMLPWLEIGQRNKGRMHTNWRQVAQDGVDGNVGARSGRLIASDPNLLNLIKKWTGRGAHGFSEIAVAKVLKALKLPTLPLVRNYMLPEKGHIWCRRDYNQQELRLLGHFEDGAIKDAYVNDPRLDIHAFVQTAIHEILGIWIEDREHVKTLNFGMLYGMGLGTLAERMMVEVEQARKLKSAQLTALPGLKVLDKTIKDLGLAGEPIVTWGGREYYAEPPRVINGHTQRFEYKLLNYLIQGSAADVTKEAVVRYHEAQREGRFLVTVYDEINVSSPKGAVKREMALLRDIMQGIETDVPMLSDGEIGPNWGDMSKFKEPDFDRDAWIKWRSAA